MSRPEDQLPPELFYSPVESEKYTSSTRIQTIQAQMSQRALELLDLQSPSLILDIGCGSGLSGSILSQAPPPAGPHTWVGMDISPAMLATALTRSPAQSPLSDDPASASDMGDLFLADMGQGVPFRPGTFDAAISISAVQWLCAAPSSESHAMPEFRIKRFFTDLYASLKRGARAVCQFYPKDDKQRDMICSAAVRAGFGAGVLEDAAGTKNEKLYLVLTVGEVGDITRVVAGVDGVEVEDRRKGRDKWGKNEKKGKGEITKGSREWILKKKERMAKQGKVTKMSSKFTGRSRGPKF